MQRVAGVRLLLPILRFRPRRPQGAQRGPLRAAKVASVGVSAMSSEMETGSQVDSQEGSQKGSQKGSQEDSWDGSETSRSILKAYRKLSTTS